jgi:hypothetical protein
MKKEVKKKDAELVKEERFGFNEREKYAWDDMIYPGIRDFIEFLGVKNSICTPKYSIDKWNKLFVPCAGESDQSNRIEGFFSDDFVYGGWDYTAHTEIYNLAVLNCVGGASMGGMLFAALYTFSFLKFYRDYVLDRLPVEIRTVIDKVEEYVIVKENRNQLFRGHPAFQAIVFCKMCHDKKFSKDISDYLWNGEKNIKDFIFDYCKDELIAYCQSVLGNKEKYVDEEHQQNLIKNVHGCLKSVQMLCDCHDKFRRIRSKEELNGLFAEYVDGSPTKQLVYIIEKLFDRWDDICAEALKKYPEINNMNNVELEILNSVGMIDRYRWLYNSFNSNSELTFKKYMSNQQISEGLTFNIRTIYYGEKIYVYINFDEMIDKIVWVYGNKITIDEIVDRLVITLRHEMGHVVDNKLRELKYPHTQTSMIVNDCADNRSRLIEQFDNLSDEEQKKHDDSLEYYTLIPEEARANELMGLSLDDIRWGDGHDLIKD